MLTSGWLYVLQILFYYAPLPTGTTAVGSENPIVPSSNAGVPLNAAAVTPEPATAVPFTETGIVDKPNTAQTSTQGFSPVNTAQQNMLLQNQNQQTDFRQGTMQSDESMLLDQNNFVNTQYFSDPSKQIAPKDQRIDFQTNPTKQQLLEAEIDQAFHEVFETNQPNPTEDNPHAAVFDEMADDLYQTMLQEQAKEEAAAGLRPAQTNAAATGWTNDGSIQYNHLGDIPASHQEDPRQFGNETKNRFSAVKIMLDLPHNKAYLPVPIDATGKSLYNYWREDVAKQNDIYISRQSNIDEQFKAHSKRYEPQNSVQDNNDTFSLHEYELNNSNTIKTLDDVLKSAQPGRVTKGKTTQYIKAGTYAQTINDFNGLDLLHVKEVNTKFGLGKLGTLPDGRTVVARPGSSDGRPTLEIRNSNGRGIEIRYGV